MLNLNSLKFRFKGFLIISLLFLRSRSIRVVRKKRDRILRYIFQCIKTKKMSSGASFKGVRTLED